MQVGEAGGGRKDDAARGQRPAALPSSRGAVIFWPEKRAPGDPGGSCREAPARSGPPPLFPRLQCRLTAVSDDNGNNMKITAFYFEKKLDYRLDEIYGTRRDFFELVLYPIKCTRHSKRKASLR